MRQSARAAYADVHGSGLSLQDIRNARKRLAARRYLRSMECGLLVVPNMETAPLVYLCKLVRDANREETGDETKG